MRKLLAFAVSTALAFSANAQWWANTNVVFLTGAGDSADNGTFLSDPNPDFYGSAAGWTNTVSGDWIFLVNGGFVIESTSTSGSHGSFGGVKYDSTTNGFPLTWSVDSYGTSPAPNGSYAMYPAVTNWVAPATNFWPVPNDWVSFNASGRNMSAGASSNLLAVLMDGKPVFLGPWCQGAGNQWTVYGRVQWDGTNLTSTGTIMTGDTNTPTWTDTEIITNAAIGTNTWSWVVLGDTNGLKFDAATFSASRATTNDVPTHSFGLSAIYPHISGTNVFWSTQP
jgi:hypothetical protein